MIPNNANFGLRSSTDTTAIGLTSVAISGTLDGMVAQIKLRQTYRNHSASNVECVYTFPLGWQAVLLGMAVQYQGKRLEGTVKPKKVAEASYEKAIASGDLPIMLERSGKDLYTANVGNLLPGEQVIIELEYAQILSVVDGRMRFSLPTVMAPRYGSATAAGLQPHQVATNDLLAQQGLQLSLLLGPSLSQGHIHSPSHRIQTSVRAGSTLLTLEHEAWLDRDFVLQVDQLEHLHDTGFILAAPDPFAPGQTTVLTSSTLAHTKPGHKASPLNIKVLVDCSGSMQGDSIVQARDAVQWLLAQLGGQDRISYSRFGSHTAHDAPMRTPSDPAHLQALREAIRKTDADMGGTELANALDEVIGLPGDEGDAYILLITDGDTWDIENSLATVRNSGHRIFAVGVGAAPAQSLLRELAEVSGGGCELVTPRESMQNAVQTQLQRMRNNQRVQHSVSANAPTLWQTYTVRYAGPGEATTCWTQLDTRAMQASTQPASPLHINAQAPHWSADLALSRIAAAMRLRDMPQASEREALALQYQLITAETNLILIHQRPDGQQATELPQLHQVRPMTPASFSASVGISMPAVWRSSRTSSSAYMAKESALDGVEIPAFLRKTADSASKAQAMRAQPPAPLPSGATPPHIPRVPQDPLLKQLQNHGADGQQLRALLQDFNETALAHNQYRTALAQCLRLHEAPYMQWLLQRHIKAAKSAAIVWAVFMAWAAEYLNQPLERHAQRLVQQFIAADTSGVQAAVLADLNKLVGEDEQVG